ncbi:MAG: transcription antitermination factor NusB [Methylacidiphilales bacterium]|nr:transcription antitermination factor NusB [Candidatus Methylacidiphilales bacterium]MDW8349821.1 transcription antitermination factor NusB [Verrucomicrobiae bacterium]
MPNERRLGRIAAMQFFYQWEAQPDSPFESQLQRFWELHEQAEKARGYGEELIRGMKDRIAELDAIIAQYVDNWELPRIAQVDRNILRVAVYEMKYRMDVPPVVSIDEAIEIAKRFSSEQSSRFINGVLDRYRKELPRPARQPTS